MHYVIETVGPIDRDYLTHVILTYMNYADYRPPARFQAGAAVAAPTFSQSRSGPTSSSRRAPNPVGWEAHRPARPGSPNNTIGSKRLPARSDLMRSASTQSLLHQSAVAVGPQKARLMERPTALQLGIELSIQPGISIRQLNDLGHTEQDLFLWEAHRRAAMLTVTNRGVHYHWRSLPTGWNNPHWDSPPPQLTTARFPSQPLDQPGGVARLSTAQKVMEAMQRAIKLVPQQLQSLIRQMMLPENIARLLLIETLYAGSLFIGVGEVATLVLVVLGAYFVGEEVLHFIDRLQAFIQTVTKATTDPELDQAARYFAETMGSGLAIAQVLFTRSRARHQPSQVVRAHGKGGAGGKKMPTTGNSAPLTTEAKPVRSKKLIAGSTEHKDQRWQDYQKNGGKWNYERWSKQYDTNMRNTKVGLGREVQYRERMGGISETRKTPLTNRQIDVSVPDRRYLGQIKTGRVSLTEQAKIDIAKDAYLVQRGFDVEYILEKGASRPFLEALDKAGVHYRIGPQIPANP